MQMQPEQGQGKKRPSLDTTQYRALEPGAQIHGTNDTQVRKNFHYFTYNLHRPVKNQTIGIDQQTSRQQHCRQPKNSIKSYSILFSIKPSTTILINYSFKNDKNNPHRISFPPQNRNTLRSFKESALDEYYKENKHTHTHTFTVHIKFCESNSVQIN